MRWQGGEESQNVEDQRRGGGGGGRMMLGGGGTLIIIVLALLFGVDPRALLQQAPGPGPQAPGPQQVNPADEELVKFVKVVLRDTEVVWDAEFRRMGDQYQYPKLTLFSGEVRSACGFANAAVGPFYCPADGKVYLDLSFFQELKSRFGAPGDFAQAYVIAHEIGHHVQNLLGISDKLHAMQGRVSKEEYNQASVRLELQADYFAGVWAHHAQQRNLLEAGDIEEALRCATAIGDDRLQMQGQGYVVPDSFTHGSSAQRVRWFKRGFQFGDMKHGDTFNAEEL